MPEIVFVELDPELARTEPDPEIQALIRASAGLNLALDYLPGAVIFDPVVEQPDAELASAVVWFDAYVTNVDRTPRNTNITDASGSSIMVRPLLPPHVDQLPRTQPSRFPMIKDHVLLQWASFLREVDVQMTRRVTDDVIDSIVKLIPEAWLVGDSPFSGIINNGTLTWSTC